MRWFKLETLAHTCMVALALASVANIGLWLTGTGENPVTSWGVAGAVGAMVVTLAIILSRIDRKRNPALFTTMLVAVIAMCTLSGTLQTFAYDRHLALWQAALLGYLLPLAGEALVGVAMSLYDGYKREALLYDADAATDEQIALQLADAMTHLDLSASRDYITERVGLLARRKIDATVERLLAAQGGVSGAAMTADASAASAISEKLSLENRQDVAVTTEGDPPTKDRIAQMNAARQSQVEERRQALSQILRTEGDPGTTALAERFGVSPNTIRSDKRALNGALPAQT